METWFMGSVKIFFAGGQLMIKGEILRAAEKMRCAFFRNLVSTGFFWERCKWVRLTRESLDKAGGRA